MQAANDAVALRLHAGAELGGAYQGAHLEHSSLRGLKTSTLQTVFIDFKDLI